MINLNYIKEENKKNRIKDNEQKEEIQAINVISAESITENNPNGEHKKCNHDCAHCKCKHKQEQAREQ